MSEESRRTAPAAATLHSELPLVLSANSGFADPQFRETVREMHRQEYPLLRMVADLGLDDELTDEVRTIIEGLSPDVVAGIRSATLAMLDREENQLPIDCAISGTELRSGVAVDVGVADIADTGGVIQVRRA